MLCWIQQIFLLLFMLLGLIQFCEFFVIHLVHRLAIEVRCIIDLLGDDSRCHIITVDQISISLTLIFIMDRFLADLLFSNCLHHNLILSSPASIIIIQIGCSRISHNIVIRAGSMPDLSSSHIHRHRGGTPEVLGRLHL